MAKSENKTDTKALKAEIKQLKSDNKELTKELEAINSLFIQIRKQARIMAEQAQAPVYRNAGECFTAMIDRVAEGKAFNPVDYARHSVKLK